jgi:nitrate/nitrite-specific signal transduction histidine kinase
MATLFATTLGISTASTVAGAIGQQQMYNANAANAAQSLRLQNRQTNLQIQQQEAADSRKAQQTQTDMLRAAATAAASAGENGVSGKSVDALINDYHAAEGRYFIDLQTQQQWNRQQADVTKLGQVATAQRQVNSVAKPTFVGTALRIAGGGLDAYNRTYGEEAVRNAQRGQG